MSKNPVVHFEFPYDDRDRMVRFYETAFGWQTQTMGEEMGNYVLATTTESGADGRPVTPGAINGGFYARSADNPAKHPSVVVAVESIDAAIAAVGKAGGEVLGKPTDIPGVGRYVAIFDTERNLVGLLQPS